MTILAMVNAEKEGQIESKMMKARQLEEIREARRKEAEARQAQKKSKLVRGYVIFFYGRGLLTKCWKQEEAKASIRQKRKNKNEPKQDSNADTTAPSTKDSSSKSKGKRKSVSFA